MSDRDPEATLREWKESMAAEHEAAIAKPDPDADHRVEAVVQYSERVRFALADGDLAETDRETVEPGEPELFSCICGVRGMSREEARTHLRAAE
ncbi:hypothetical protein [Halosegnis marinus]|uniref:Uncharacterized protein n=1 Tax=Halosegnis marinus TaxID=3034023 RepID=A0ABD5ZPK4_9EURY|nr:hypothetical protein [Halosegnis sp. DT85]